MLMGNKKNKNVIPPIEDYALFSVPDVTPAHNAVYTGESEYVGKLWKIALDDIEKSRVTTTEFGTIYTAGGYGKSFFNLVFNRDNAYSGLLALNCLYPEEMLEAYKAIRQVRYRLGWTCFKSCGCGLMGVPEAEILDMERVAFFKKYQKASAINKTDDVCWLWAAYDLLMKHDFPISEWEWLYENGKIGFEQYYKVFYDESDGLYFGQPTFIDIGHSGYPDGYNKPTTKKRNKCVWLKASSTNCLYYKGMCVMSEAAKRLGKTEEAAAWAQRAEKIKAAILKNLRAPDGSFYYFLYRDGTPEHRSDVLGSAFPVLMGIVEGEDARLALKNFPVTHYGIPLIQPFYERDDFYHNNSMWPFADTFFLLAYEKAYGVSTAEVNLQIMLNSFKNGHFYEQRNVKDNKPGGSWAQLWTTAGFLNVIIRKGDTDIPLTYDIIY